MIRFLHATVRNFCWILSAFFQPSALPYLQPEGSGQGELEQQAVTEVPAGGPSPQAAGMLSALPARRTHVDRWVTTIPFKTLS